MFTYKNLYSLGLLPGDNVIGDYHRFKRVDRNGFNQYDNPDVRFFKLLFYFYDNDPSYNGGYYNGTHGLLAPTWLTSNGTDKYEYLHQNTAYAYLINNCEYERALVLRDFITLLSQISSESPWYFKEITGLDEALVREKWTVPEERKKISIVCMNDPADHRIESLLSMYRSIVWSHTRKCEVVPSNLRKFDMGLFVFSGLTYGLTHTYTTTNRDLSRLKVTDLVKKGAAFGHLVGNELSGFEEQANNIKNLYNAYSDQDTLNKMLGSPNGLDSMIGNTVDVLGGALGDGLNAVKATSKLITQNWKNIDPQGNYDSISNSSICKYLEFHNCEINIDSLKSGYAAVNNETGFEQTFTIDIYFDDIYEHEYNPQLLRGFGDLFIADAWTASRNARGEVTNAFPSMSEVAKELQKNGQQAQTLTDIGQQKLNNLIKWNANSLYDGIANLITYGQWDTLSDEDLRNSVMALVDEGKVGESEDDILAAMNHYKSLQKNYASLTEDFIKTTLPMLPSLGNIAGKLEAAGKLAEDINSRSLTKNNVAEKLLEHTLGNINLDFLGKIIPQKLDEFTQSADLGTISKTPNKTNSTSSDLGSLDKGESKESNTSIDLGNLNDKTGNQSNLKPNTVGLNRLKSIKNS
jgi:hypothetical protein